MVRMSRITQKELTKLPSEIISIKVSAKTLQNLMSDYPENLVIDDLIVMIPDKGNSTLGGVVEDLEFNKITPELEVEVDPQLLRDLLTQ